MTDIDSVHLQPLTILMVVPWYPPPVVGGLEKQAQLLSNGLSAIGHRVLVVSYSKTATMQIRQQDCVEVHEIGGTPKGLFSSFRVFWRLWNKLRQLAKMSDVVHVHVPSWFGVLALVLSQWNAKPSLFKLSNVGELGIPGLQKTLSGRLRLAVIRRSSGMVAMTDQSVQELDEIQYPRQNVLFRPNGVELKGTIIRQAASPDIVIFTYVGRLSWEKCLPDLLEAWATARSRLQGAQLLIAGSGPDHNLLLRLVTDLGIAETVQFLGHVDDIGSLLAQSDVFVLPSALEGNSNAVLEAMAAGLPIVSTNLSGTMMQVGQEGASLLFEPRDTVSLSNILVNVYKDRLFRENIGKKMRRRAERLFSMQAVVKDYAESYEILSGRRNSMLSLLHENF